MRIDIKNFDEYFSFQGRRYAQSGRLFLNHSGASVQGRFKGNALALRVFSDHEIEDRIAFVRLTVDGRTRRVALSRGERVLRARCGEGEHFFEVVKLTETTNNSFALVYAETDGEFLPFEEKSDWKIEFIGDSITTGFGTLAPLGIGEYKTKEQDVTKAFPYLTACSLGARYQTVAAGGWGVYRSKYADHAIPEIYENVDFFRNEEKWDFSSFSPNAVVITLGTNDFSYLSDLSEEDQARERIEIKKSFTFFVRRVAFLNAGAKILLLCGFFDYPGLNSLTREVAAEIPGVIAVETPSAASMSDVRAGHPGRRAHRAAAARLVFVLKSLGAH